MQTRLILSFFILLGMLTASCTGNKTQQTSNETNVEPIDATDSMAHLNDTVLCYERLEGELTYDSTYVYLKLNGDSVQGVYHWIPDGKDARRGVLYGYRRGDTIQVVWNFTQEGIEDTLRTAFLLQADGLKQRPFRVDQQTGRQVMDAHADFSIRYTLSDCPPLIAGID